jgi:hypothetical protein
MKNQIIKLAFVITLAVFSSCNKVVDEIGPRICPPDSFTFSSDKIMVSGLDADKKVDLSTGGLKIKANFGQKVKWNLKITSDLSQKEYSGEGDSIQVLWYGNSDNYPLFDVGNCKIELEIPCRDTYVSEFVVSKKPTFSNLDPSFGVLIRDWDMNGKFDVGGTEYNGGDGWAGVNGSDTSYFNYFTENPSYAGGYYAEFYSKNDALLWYYGSTSFSTNDLETYLSTTNTDSLYLNIMVQGYGVKNTNMEVALQAATVSYFYTEPITWTGWKMVSVKISDMKVLSGPSTGQTLTTLAGVNFAVMQLGAAPLQGVEAKSGYDFMMITVGEPFFKD